MPAASKAASVPQILEVIFRHKKKVVLIPTLVILAGLGIALFGKRSYRSEAKIKMQVGRESVAVAPTASTGQPTINLQQLGREGEIATAMELMTSRGVLAKVVDEIGPERILDGTAPGDGAGEAASPNWFEEAYDNTVGIGLGWVFGVLKSIDEVDDRERAIIELEDNVVVDAERDSTLIVLTYCTDTPAGAQYVLDTLIDVYTLEHLRIHRNQGSREFFQEKEKKFRENLDEAMDLVRAEKDRVGVASIETRRQHLESQLQRITVAAYEAEASRNAELAELKDLRRQLDSLPERMVSSKRSVPNQGADLLREQLYALQVRQADLKARFSDSHPLVVAISQQVEQAEQVVEDQTSVREETTDDINPIHRQLSLSAKQKHSRIMSLDARLAALRDQDAMVRSDMKQLNAEAVKIAQLEREEQILSGKYIRYEENLEQARIDDELQKQQISSVSIAQFPTLEQKPVSPSKLLVGLGSLVLAFAGTGAIVLGLEQISDKPRTERALEQVTGVPVLASIPESSVHGRVLAP